MAVNIFIPDLHPPQMILTMNSTGLVVNIEFRGVIVYPVSNMELCRFHEGNIPEDKKWIIQIPRRIMNTCIFTNVLCSKIYGNDIETYRINTNRIHTELGAFALTAEDRRKTGFYFPIRMKTHWYNLYGHRTIASDYRAINPHTMS